MTKILYISNIHDGTGWSNASHGYILSLDSVGYDVVVRSIKLNNINGFVPPRILELEKKSTHGCDIVIQHVLPHLCEYNRDLGKNICLFVSETSSIKMTAWPNYLNQMDEVWVPNTSMIKSCRESNVLPPIKMVPHAFDISKYEKRYDKIPFPELADKFIFYFIGENIRRKNIAGLLRAFHTEFSPNEPVGLLIKTSAPGMSPEVCGKQMSDFCNMIKQNLKLYKKQEDYHREVIVTEHLSDEDIMKIHATGDCFVNMSYGEAWSIPAFEAMSYGNPVISNNCGGPADFLCGSPCLVENKEEPVFGALETFQDHNTANENWYIPNLNQVRKLMRKIYEDKDFREETSLNQIARSHNYSYENVGKIMKGLLEC